jgi:deoxyadenosine/deoxycytidine kinase
MELFTKPTTTYMMPTFNGNKQTRFISISGNIGCGKSSLLSRLKSNFNISVEPEPVTDWGEWLRMFYLDPKRHALGLQVKILLCFRELLNNNGGRDKSIPVLFERSPIEGVRVFARTLDHTKQPVLSSMEINLLEELVSVIGWVPHTYIYLRTTPAKCLERIKLRNIGVEQNISQDYITDLHDKYEDLFANNPVGTIVPYQIIVVDADDTQEAVYQKVSGLLVENEWFNAS